MAIETELKLRIAPEHLQRLKRHPFLRSLSSKRAATHRLYSVYFDTPDLQLHGARMALRLRRVGTQWLQTLKGGGGVRAGLHQRNEWETPVSSEQLDFAALDAAGAIHLPLSLRAQVQPLFVTDFARSIRMVEFEGALIELGLDSGEIRAGKSTYPISELELELKFGEPLQLYRLALALLEIVPLEIESTSKAEYGYRLRSPAPPSVSKAAIPEFDAHASVGDALQSMIWSCLHHLQANVHGAVQKTDDEYLHQVRVALRRLRVVLNMTAKYRDNTELQSLRHLVGELGRALGSSREWDVFVAETLPAILKDVGEYTEMEMLIGASEKRRQDSQQLVHAALQPVDFQRLLLRFGAWMNGEYWKKSANPINIKYFSNKMLCKYEQKVWQRGKYIQSKMSNEQLHRLRIACKNLRYSIELFGSPAGLENGPYLKKLINLQSVLGKLHDNAVALNLLNEFRQGSRLTHIALIRDVIERHHSHHLSKLSEAWQKFKKLKVNQNE